MGILLLVVLLGVVVPCAQLRAHMRARLSFEQAGAAARHPVRVELRR